MRIAILENDATAAQLLDEWLGAAGHALRYFASGNLFTRELDRQSFDVAIVGSTPADVRAAELTRTLRDRQTGVPLIRVLQKGGEQDIVAALNAGADDCIATARQFELLARVEALARRTKQPTIVTDEVLEFGNFSVNVRNRLILRDGVRVTLTPKTYNLALLLLTNCGQLLTRSYLLERIWGPNCSQSTRTLDTHISRLRTVLGLLPAHGWQLQSVYQHGYRLDQRETLHAHGGKPHGEILAQACN